MTRTLIKKIIAAILLIIGLVALFTPLTPGGWLVLVGGELLGLHILSPYKVKEYLRLARSPSGWF